MAHAEKDEVEENMRKDNIITLKHGDSQESLDEVNNFIFLSPAYIILSFYPLLCSFSILKRRWRVASNFQRCVEENKSGPVECSS